MSTFGKVLVALNTVFLLVWIFFMASVANLNANWGLKIKKLQEEIAALQPQIPKVLEDVERTKAEASLLQVDLDKSRASFRSDLAALQRAESDSKEAVSRYTIQLAATLAAAKSSRDREEYRKKEKADTWAELDKSEADVKAETAENQRLRDELKGLQDSFKQTLAENKDMLQKARKPALRSE